MNLSSIEKVALILEMVQELRTQANKIEKEALEIIVRCPPQTCKECNAIWSVEMPYERLRSFDPGACPHCYRPFMSSSPLADARSGWLDDPSYITSGPKK